MPAQRRCTASSRREPRSAAAVELPRHSIVNAPSTPQRNNVAPPRNTPVHYRSASVPSHCRESTPCRCTGPGYFSAAREPGRSKHDVSPGRRGVDRHLPTCIGSWIQLFGCGARGSRSPSKEVFSSTEPLSASVSPMHFHIGAATTSTATAKPATRRGSAERVHSHSDCQTCMGNL